MCNNQYDILALRHFENPYVKQSYVSGERRTICVLEARLTLSPASQYAHLSLSSATLFYEIQDLFFCRIITAIINIHFFFYKFFN